MVLAAGSQLFSSPAGMLDSSPGPIAFWRSYTYRKCHHIFPISSQMTWTYCKYREGAVSIRVNIYIFILYYCSTVEVPYCLHHCWIMYLMVILIYLFSNLFKRPTIHCIVNFLLAHIHTGICREHKLVYYRMKFYFKITNKIHNTVEAIHQLWLVASLKTYYICSESITK